MPAASCSSDMTVWTARVLEMARKRGNFSSNASEAMRQPQSSVWWGSWPDYNFERTKPSTSTSSERKNWSPDCIMLVRRFLRRCLMQWYWTDFHNDTSILWCRRASILQRISWNWGSVSPTFRRAADREMMWRRISTLPCQQRMLLIKLVYTLHSNHILGRLFLSLVVPKALDCFVCNKPFNKHLAASCYKKDNAVCSICKAKGHLASACKHQQKSPHKCLASSLSADSSFEVSKTDLVVDSGSTDHMMIDKTWFKNYQN